MWLLWVVIFFSVAVTLHAIFCRVLWKTNTVVKFLLTGLAAGAFLIWVETWGCGLTVEAVAGILFYAFLCELYIFFITFVVTSLSVRILFELNDDGLVDDVKREMSSVDLIMHHRIDGLVKERLMVQDERGHFVTARGRVLVGTFKALQNFFGTGKKGVLD